MPFVKGKSGNPKGAPIKEESLTGLMQLFLKEIPKGKKRTHKESFIRKCFSIAMKGDIAAMRLIWNYLEGMPKESKDINANIKIEKFGEIDEILQDNSNIQNRETQ